MSQDVQVELTFYFTLGELCDRSGSSPDFILDLVDLGIITPLKSTPTLVFDAVALNRLRRAQRLQRDLNINTPGIAMSLELLEEVEQLRREVGLLRQLIQQLGGI